MEMKATWGADPLERLGGFRNLTLQTDATFVSSLGRAASVKWFEAEAKQILSACDAVQADLVLQFDEIDFAGLQGVYGWPALQYQAWTRGHIFVGQEHAQTVLLYIEGVLEFYVDEEHYFGGDVYSFGKIPVVLKLSPGHHRLDIRLIRDVRAMGAIVSPAINVRIKAELSSPGLTILESHEMLPDVVDGQLSSSVASLLVRNDDEKSVEIIDVEVMGNLGQAALDNSSLPKSLVPGQTRSLTVRISCRATCPETLEFVVVARKSSAATGHRSYRVKSPAFNIRYRSLDEVFKLTYRHPTGTVGYVMLKAPHIESWTSRSGIKDTLPIMLVLHGAGLEADAAELTRSLDDAGKLGAFVIFPTGGSPWSGDDWHQSGSIHVESAVLATEEWARSSGWSGPKPRIDHWLVVGHSNGGQGTWYTLTHHPDRVAGAAALSGYSSIQSEWNEQMTKWTKANDGKIMSHIIFGTRWILQSKPF
ncbi:hypothetical protein ANO11243_017070 [Dothideomycetidae sp. 11243]|nr:hypothetical protein ANO11243_017070 [fungal sp. No.11243]